MLCLYSYMTKDKKSYGEFQADTEDFKNFWKQEHQNCRCAVVKTDNEWWIFYRGVKPVWQKVKGGKKCYQLKLDL